MENLLAPSLEGEALILEHVDTVCPAIVWPYQWIEQVPLAILFLIYSLLGERFVSQNQTFVRFSYELSSLDLELLSMPSSLNGKLGLNPR